MTAATQGDVKTVQVYRVYIKATPEAIWEAITDPDWTNRYGYRGRVDIDLRPGGAYAANASEAMRAGGAPEVVIVGEVIEADPPRRLVMTWHPVWSEEAAAETPTRLTYEIEPGDGGFTKLTVVHDVAGAGGGWAWVLSDLKTLLETGSSLAG